jgi:hypothetical protein
VGHPVNSAVNFAPVRPPSTLRSLLTVSDDGRPPFVLFNCCDLTWLRTCSALKWPSMRLANCPSRLGPPFHDPSRRPNTTRPVLQTPSWSPSGRLLLGPVLRIQPCLSLRQPCAGPLLPSSLGPFLLTSVSRGNKIPDARPTRAQQCFSRQGRHYCFHVGEVLSVGAIQGESLIFLRKTSQFFVLFSQNSVAKLRPHCVSLTWICIFLRVTKMQIGLQ